MPPLQTMVRQLESKLTALQAHVDDKENRMRRSNIRVIGLPESAEGDHSETFLEKLLINNFGKEAFSTTFTVACAHRIIAKPPIPGAPPRTFIAKMLNYRDSLLRLAREKGPIKIEIASLSFFLNFSIELHKKRAQFFQAKKRLQELNMSYVMLYPAKLRITYNGKATFFTAPEEVHN